VRVLVAHNRYRQPGGEDVVAASEAELLASYGHTVERFGVDNDHITGPLAQINAALSSIYSLKGRRLLESAIDRIRPDVVHVHNFFPTLSPSVFYACSEARVPVVHTLHNYRIICASATLFRDGAICEECILKQSIMPGIRHACYRSSRIGSAVSGLSMALHDHWHTWSSKVSAFIALSHFAADKLGSYRIPRDKIFVKPNSTVDGGLGAGNGGYALYVGRLIREKGIQTLIEADAMGSLCMDVLILGDGAMAGDVRRAAERPGSHLVFKGFQNHDQIVEYMRNARVLIMPSIWYEGGLPLVVIEAFSLGLPVIGADVGNVGDLLQSGETGLLYQPGDPLALSAALRRYADDPVVAKKMRGRAREYYLATHTPEKNYHRLIEIYGAAIQSHREH
jgi:glycosyltransferase involved in cell wall biosynthesis